MCLDRSFGPIVPELQWRTKSGSRRLLRDRLPRQGRVVQFGIELHRYRIAVGRWGRHLHLEWVLLEGRRISSALGSLLHLLPLGLVLPCDRC